MSRIGDRSPVPRVYLAGPFTAHLQQAPTAQNLGNGTATPSQAIHGSSPWRNALLATESALTDMGYCVFLPHRDVSAWGEREITAPQVVQECISAVLESDLVVALLGESFGTHVEVGVAIGNRTPVIVIRSGDRKESYFGSGLTGSPFATEIRVPDVSRIAAAVGRPEFSGALRIARDRTAAC